MASGWAREGAIQDQIDASVNDAVQYARSNLYQSAKLCDLISTLILIYFY